ncbi:MAG: hypothetical protein ACI9DC_005047 [Gammaproteobacteria bacterium]|jgi:hypothetical protein
MHSENNSQHGAAHWLVIVGVALMCSIAIAAWLWITPQRVASAPTSPTTLPPISIPTAKTMPAGEGRQAMTGSNAGADIEQRVRRLADAARRKSPDVSQFPAADTNNDAWPTVQAETQVPAVAHEPQASRTEQVKAEPDPQRETQTTKQQSARAETAISSAEINIILSAARADLARDRLTTPAGANALERFQAVLALDPANADATSGLHAIVTKYLALAKRVARAGRFDKAESFLQRAERVGVNADTLLAARQQLAEMRANR